MATANDSRSSRSDQEGLLRRCIESAPVAIAMYDREMRYIATSRVYRELMGISATDPTGRCLYDVIHDFPRDWREIHQRCLSGASETCEAERHVRPTGEVAWHRWRIEHWRQADDSIGGLVVHVQDITEERAERFALNAALTRFHRLADALPISVAKVEADRALSYINSFGASWFGKTPADLIGRDILEINPNLRRQDFSTAVSAALSGQLNRNEQYLKFPGGVERWCEFFRIPETTSAGDPDGYYVLMIDASARKQAEADRTRILEQYRFVADNLPVFLVHLDKEMRIDLVNRTGAQWCARAPHEVVGRLLSDVFDDSVSSNDLLARLTKDDRANSATQEHEIFLRFPDGTSRQCMAIHAPDNAGDGHLRGRLLLLIDITARKQAYSKLEASEARFSAFMDALPAAAWVKDTDGHLTFMNQTLKAALAASDPGHDVPNFAVDPVWPNLRERRDATDREVLVHGRPTHTFFETRDRNTGEIRYWQTIKFPICDNERRETLVGGIAIDLTEKMRAQKLLEASEARFSAFMDALPATAVIKDATGRYVYMNRRWDDLGRGPRHEWMNRTAIEMMPPEIAGRAAELDLRVLQSGEPVEYVAEYPRPDGGIGVWRHSKFRFAGSSGQPLIGMISIDVTKEHLLEQERRESAARRRLAVAAANIGQWDWDLRTGKIVYSSEWKRQIGYEDDEIADRLEEWSSRVHPDDFDRAWDLAERYIAGRASKYDLEFRFRHKNGSYRWIYCAGILLRDDASTPVRFMGVHIDITDRKNTELSLQSTLAQYSLVAESIPAFVLHVGSDLRVRFVNRVAQEWYARPASEIVGRDLMDVVLTSRAERLRDLIPRVLAGESGSFEEQVPFPDGVVRWCQFSATPERDAAGKIVGFYAFAIDVTTQRAAEERLRETSKMESLGQVTGGIAHDFNNLLMVISGNLDLVGQQIRADDPMRDFIAASTRAAQRGADLTKRLLAFSRRMPLRPELVDINHLAREAVEMLWRVLGEGITIAMDLRAAPARVNVDPGEMQSALLNLALNARDAMGGRGSLTIRTSNASEVPNASPSSGASYVQVSVCDTGSGMAPEVVKRAIDPFFTTKAPGKGSGLGLSMVYGFVRQTGGHLSIDSKVGEGTTVSLYLPATAAAETAPAPGRLPSKIAVEALRVLLVEDDDGVRDVVCGQLEASGYETKAVAQGDAAIALLRSDEPFDLLLTDVVLPGGMNGFDIAHAARKLRPGLAILCMSGYSDEARNSSGQLANEFPLLDKPFTREQLADALARIFPPH